jgi:hypothetical protein
LNYWTIKKAVYSIMHFRGFFPKLGYFAGFFLYIINIAGRIREAAMGGAGGEQRPVLPVKKTSPHGALARTSG